MTTRTDLVMPKLGLTMTEGKVASWNVQPGASFAAGDIVVVVETDKIAFDVEAPGAGALAEILVPEGETVAVGTPIAQWLPADGAAATAVEAKQPEAASTEAKAPAPAAVTAPAPTPSSAPTSAGGRIVATPYARRLARNADLNLATVSAANGRRITAADVEAGIARRAEAPSAAPAVAAQAGLSTAPAFAFYGVDIAADRLLVLIGEIAAAQPDLQPSLSHFVAFAAARTLGASDGLIALQHNDRTPRLLTMDATRRLSTLIAADRAETVSTEGRIALLVSDADGATLVGRAPINCDAALGVGALTRAFHPDADGKPVLRAQFNLMLTVGAAAAVPDAPGLLTRIRALLENPLLLLAS